MNIITRQFWKQNRHHLNTKKASVNINYSAKETDESECDVIDRVEVKNRGTPIPSKFVVAITCSYVILGTPWDADNKQKRIMIRK